MNSMLLRQGSWLGFIVALAACGSSGSKKTPTPAVNQCVKLVDAESVEVRAIQLAAAPVGYSGAVKQLLDTKCATAGCHGGARIPNLAGFANAKANGARIIAASVTGSSMPVAGFPALTQAEKQLLADWQSNLFAETGTVSVIPASPTPVPSTTPRLPMQPLWTDVAPILAKNCATANCHIVGRQAPDLTNYQATKAAIVKINAAVDKQPGRTGFMPKRGTVQLNLDSRKILTSWELLGAPQLPTQLPQTVVPSQQPTPVMSGTPGPQPSPTPNAGACK